MPTNEPNYQVLSRNLRMQIRQGEFSDGHRLPTEAELSQRYGLSRQTVRRAFQDLVSEGLVYRIRGRGTYARSGGDGYVRQVGSVDDLMGLSEDTAMEVVRPLTRKVDPINAGRLRLAADVVYEMQFVRIHDGVRFCTTTVALPPSVAKLLDSVEEPHKVGSVSTITIIGLLESRLPFAVKEAQQSITVDRFSETDAKSLSTEVGSPSLRVDRLYFGTDGDPVELAISHFVPEHYSYRISLRRNA
ncbi:GntR family transcriptional regulator [Saccharopolyspora sp. NPDC000995]